MSHLIFTTSHTSAESQAQNHGTQARSSLDTQTHLVSPNKYLKKAKPILMTLLIIHI